MSRKPRVISLFSGAGGIDYGLEHAGFRTIAAVELDQDAAATLRLNRPRWNTFADDIASVPSEALKAGADEVDLVAGGPPCQPFSKAGYWARGDSPRLEDPRARTLDEYLRVVEDVLPRVFLLENVAAMGYSGKSEGIEHIKRRVEEINARHRVSYKIEHQVLMAADYGVPQLRERFFMVAARDGTRFRFPEATHQRIERGVTPRLGAEPYHTAWDALGDLKDQASPELRARGKWADLLPSIPEGKNYLHHTARGEGQPLFGWRRRYWSFLLKLAKDLPSWTIQAQPGPAIGPFHWESRLLSARELCRLQTFPDSVEISGPRSAIQRQLGNAVPSLMAEVLGREIRTQLLGRRRPQSPPKLMPTRRDPAPPETPAPVPQKYLRLRGQDGAHPGTGKGRRAASEWASAAE